MAAAMETAPACTARSPTPGCGRTGGPSCRFGGLLPGSACPRVSPGRGRAAARRRAGCDAGSTGSPGSVEPRAGQGALARERRRWAKAWGLFLTIILLITVLLPLAVAFPSSWQGPGSLMAAGAGEPRGAGRFGAGRACGPCLEPPLSSSGVLFPVGLAMLFLRSVSKHQHQRGTRAIPENLASSKTCCRNLARLRRDE